MLIAWPSTDAVATVVPEWSSDIADIAWLCATNDTTVRRESKSQIATTLAALSVGGAEPALLLPPCVCAPPPPPSTPAHPTASRSWPTRDRTERVDSAARSATAEPADAAAEAGGSG
jgi:hypothetical protein